MSPHANVAPPFGTSRRRPGRAALRALILAGALLVMAQYLAGYIYIVSIGGNPRYVTPLTSARYAYYFGQRAEVRQHLIVSTAAAWVLILAATAVIAWPRRRALHGDARFARRGEIAAAGLLGEGGIILGRLGDRILMLPGQQGVALAAPPRAGKGVGVVVPNALHWPGSLVCIDIKRENWQLTAGFRQHSGQACYLFDPFAEDGCTAQWNPLFYVSSDPARRVNDLQRIAAMLYPDPPNVDPFWSASARSLFLGLALYVFETPSLPSTIGEVLRQGMASDEEGFCHHWKRLIEGRKAGAHALSAACVRAIYDVIDLAPVTASSIRKTFTSRLDLWQNPMLDVATSDNSFDLRELRRRPMSIYVGVNPDDLHRLRPLLSLFFQQAIGLQTRELPERNSSLKYQVLMLLDEFTALGRIPIIAEAISYLPGFNVRVVLVIQTPAQLRDVYGVNGAETMLKSLAARIVFAPKDFADAREISDELGNTTVNAKSVSRSLDLFTRGRGRGRSESVSEQRRALLLPQEVKDLDPDEEIIFYEGVRPIRCKKIRYYEDKRFSARVRPAPVVRRLQPVATATAVDPHTPNSIVARDGSAVVGEGGVAAPAAEGVTSRDATIADLSQLKSLTLEDFDVDFSAVRLPDKASLTHDELQRGVEDFLRTLRQ